MSDVSPEDARIALLRAEIRSLRYALAIVGEELSDPVHDVHIPRDTQALIDECVEQRTKGIL